MARSPPLGERFIGEVPMGVLDLALLAVTGLFVLGAIGCLIALPSIVWQFVRVLFEKEEPEEQSHEEAEDTWRENTLRDRLSR
jgi:hypothetical protein